MPTVEEAIRKMDQICVDNVIQVLNGNEPISGVNFPLPFARG